MSQQLRSIDVNLSVLGKLCTRLAISAFSTLGACDTSSESNVQEVEHRTQAVEFSDCQRRADTSADAAFYRWDPSELAGPEGSIMRCDQLDYDKRFTGYTTYRVMYRTTSLVTEGGVTHEILVPATGIVYVPTSEVDTSKPRPVIANTHGLTGLIPSCGTSPGLGFDDKVVGALLGVVQDAVVVVPDYVGLGLDHGARTPDVNLTVPQLYNVFARVKPFSNVTHPFVSLTGEGRATVDLVRAARDLPDSNTGESPKWFAVGQSQGGHAALASAEVVTSGYGSEMQLLGVVAGAPATEFQNQNWDSNFKRGLQAMVTVGLSLEDRDLPASSFLSTQAMGAFALTTNSGCATPMSWLNIYAVYQTGAVPTLWKRDPFQDPQALARIEANSPGRVQTNIPIFVGQVIGDPFIREARTRDFITRVTGNNTAGVTYCEYASVVGSSATLLERFKNHDALGPMFAGHTCRDRNGVAQFDDPDTKLVPRTALGWVKDVWDEAHSSD